MVGHWIPPSTTASATTVIIHVHASTAAGTNTLACSCDHPAPGFACVADRHATLEDLELRAVLRALERRGEFRDFVGYPPIPPALAPRSRRETTPAHTVWRTRALGKRPQLTASG